MTVFGGIAEFERSLILSRTQEGREVAMARGVAFGRPSKLREDQKDAVRDLVKDGRFISVVARTLWALTPHRYQKSHSESKFPIFIRNLYLLGAPHY